MYRRQTKIPTLVALFILVFGIGGGILLIETSHPTTTSADVNIIPNNIHITNVSDSSFSVSWLTDRESNGYVTYKDTSSVWQTAFDDRDEDGKPKKYVTHHVSVKSLRENTSYSFKIVSDGKVFDNNGSLFAQVTGPRLSAPLSLDPAYGVILQTNDKPATGALVYVTVGKSMPLSTIVKSEGTWLVPLNNSRNQDLLSRPEISNPEILQISVVFDKSQSLMATTDTKNDTPVPTMNLGKTYDFRNIQSKKNNAVAKTSPKPNVLGANITSTPAPIPTLQKQSASGKKVDLLFPASEKQTTTDSKPFIKGVGIPGKTVIVTVNSTPQIGKTTVDSDGTWNFTPPKTLPPGTHTVNISTTDAAGNPVSLTRSFIVLKSGESVLGDATPSATLYPSAIPTFAPDFTITPIATTTPPVTGAFGPTLAFLGAGIVFVILGLRYLII